MDNKTVGVLGGGQLGRMLTEAANRLNVKIVTLDTEGAPAKQINCQEDHVNGSFKDPEAICRIAERCDVLTVEIEHVDTDVLEGLAMGTRMRSDWKVTRGTKTEVQPSWRTIRVIQDKYDQKEHLTKHGISTARSVPVKNNDIGTMKDIGSTLGYPFMLKSRTEAYDGRGNYPVKSADDIHAALDTLRDRPLYAEQWANFSAELAVMVVKTEDNAAKDWERATMAFPVVETVHEDSICKVVYAPARDVSTSIMERAQTLARRSVASFWGKGIFGVEMFLVNSGELLINEIAPRPHNSGHYTIEACSVSQFDAHLSAILGWPIPEESLLIDEGVNFIMLNILGGVQPNTHLLVAERARSIPGAKVHLYGKGSARPGRKMGHVTVKANSMREAENRIRPLVELADQIRADRQSPGKRPTNENGGLVQQPDPMPKQGGAAPLVAVTMGSDSDRHVLAPGINLLKELEIPYSVTITSAHRTPQRMVKFAEDAASNGIKVIIAAAGGAAHLPGMVAANTWLPVIGVPVKASVLDGLDSLLSIVQMPRGCPVASVAINNSVNAAQLAVRILGVGDAGIRQRLQFHLAAQTASVQEKAQKMEEYGFDAYGTED